MAFFIYFLGGPLTFFSFYGWLINKLASNGINPWLAGIMAVPLAFLLFYAVVLLFSFHEGKRILSILLISIFLVVSCYTMYSFTQDQYFKKWYSKSPEGYRIYSKGGFDPVTGEKLEKITPEIAREIEIWKKYKNEPLQPIKEKNQFFDNWGRAIRWYYRYPNGKIEIFKWKGFHPITGEELLPVTKEIVQEYLKQLAEEEKIIKKKTQPQPKKTAVTKLPSLEQNLQKVIYEEKIIETPLQSSQNIAEQAREEIDKIVFPEVQKEFPINYKETLEKYGTFVTANYDSDSGTFCGVYKNILIKFEDPNYKEVWIPETNNDPDWQPYKNGRWEDYENNTYIWISNEPFGKIVYHFGRWQWHPELGWYWIPTYEWGPAWVNWYWYNDYVYWSPCYYDPRYYQNFSEYYTKPNKKIWVGIKREQLKSPILNQIVKTSKTPSIKINPSRITPNFQARTPMPLITQSPAISSPRQKSPSFLKKLQPILKTTPQQPQQQPQPYIQRQPQSQPSQRQNPSPSLKDMLKRNQPTQPPPKKGSPPVRKAPSSPPKKK